MSKIRNIIKSIIVLFFAMFLFGCTEVESHTHTYSSNWSYNEQQHGHRCTFKNCTSIKDVAKHEFLNSYIKEKPTHIKKGIKAYKCKVCNYEKTEEIDTLKEHTYTKIEKHNSSFHKIVCECGAYTLADHKLENEEIYIKPTHMSTGVMKYTCKECEDIIKMPIEKLKDHTYETIAKNDKETHKIVCKCGEFIKEDHTWNEGVVTTKPTHFEYGIKTYTCTICNDTKEERIEKTQYHSFSDWKFINEKQHQRECACGVTDIDDHTWNDGVVTTKPTHLEYGVKTYTCTFCEGTKEEQIEKLKDHTYEIIEKNDKDTHKIVCKCGDFIKENHTWNNGEITKAATHLEEGVKTYTCTICNDTKEKQIEKLKEHNFNNWTSIDDEKHQRTCECGAFETGIHVWDDGIIREKPTHLYEGTKVFRCKDCSKTRFEIIEKLTEHEYGDWHYEDGLIHDIDKVHVRCCPCGDYQEEEHTLKETIIKDPTHLEYGNKKLECTKCNYKKTQRIDKTPNHTYGEWFEFDKFSHHRTCECGKYESNTHEWDNGVLVDNEGTKEKKYTCKVCNATKFEEITYTIITNKEDWEKLFSSENFLNFTMKNISISSNRTDESFFKFIEDKCYFEYYRENGTESGIESGDDFYLHKQYFEIFLQIYKDSFSYLKYDNVENAYICNEPYDYLFEIAGTSQITVVESLKIWLTNDNKVARIETISYSKSLGEESKSTTIYIFSDYGTTVLD